jgi:hypothetical protein
MCFHLAFDLEYGVPVTGPYIEYYAYEFEVAY